VLRQRLGTRDTAGMCGQGRSPLCATLHTQGGRVWMNGWMHVCPLRRSFFPLYDYLARPSCIGVSGLTLSPSPSLSLSLSLGVWREGQCLWPWTRRPRLLPRPHRSGGPSITAPSQVRSHTHTHTHSHIHDTQAHERIPTYTHTKVHTQTHEGSHVFSQRVARVLPFHAACLIAAWGGGSLCLSVRHCMYARPSHTHTLSVRLYVILSLSLCLCMPQRRLW
jgi:hypothetical protein